MTVHIDPEVLAATVLALDDLAADLPGLFARASSLDARIDMAGMNGAEQWAQESATDLRSRIGVLEQMALALPSFGGVTLDADAALQIAGQSMSVEDALIVVSTLDPPVDAWQDTDPANLGEWFEQMQAEALQKLAGMSDSDQATALVDAYNDVRNFTEAAGAAIATVTSLVMTGGPALANWIARREIVAPVLAQVAGSSPGIANWLAGALKFADNNYLRGKLQFHYPGSFVPNLTQKVLLMAAPVVENFDAWVVRLASATKAYALPGEVAARPTMLASMLKTPLGTQATDWVSGVLRTTGSGQLAQRLAGWGNNVFGRAWTNPVTQKVAGRGAGNLLTMVSKSGVRTMAASAGALRILGVAGSAVATVDGVVGLVNNWDENAELWSEGGTAGKAHVVGEYAETAFNASMTAAMIAPNPVTLGLVAASGIVWGVATAVEHWDDVERAADAAVDWVGDRADDATQWVGDQLDAVKESDLNPMNWF